MRRRKFVCVTWRCGDITGLTYISQMIPTDVGQSYLLTFYIKNYVTPGEEVVDRGELWWGGTLIDSGTNVPSFDDPNSCNRGTL